MNSLMDNFFGSIFTNEQPKPAGNMKYQPVKVLRSPPKQNKIDSTKKFRSNATHKYSDYQSFELEREYKFDKLLRPERLARVAQRLNLTHAQVSKWFRNRSCTSTSTASEKAYEIYETPNYDRIQPPKPNVPCNDNIDLLLEDHYQYNKYAKCKRQASLAQRLRITDFQVDQWFRNRREKSRQRRRSYDHHSSEDMEVRPSYSSASVDSKNQLNYWSLGDENLIMQQLTSQLEPMNADITKSLEREYQARKYVNRERQERTAQRLDLTEDEVNDWFQTRRAKSIERRLNAGLAKDAEDLPIYASSKNDLFSTFCHDSRGRVQQGVQGLLPYEDDIQQPYQLWEDDSHLRLQTPKSLALPAAEHETEFFRPKAAATGTQISFKPSTSSSSTSSFCNIRWAAKQKMESFRPNAPATGNRLPFEPPPSSSGLSFYHITPSAQQYMDEFRSKAPAFKIPFEPSPSSSLACYNLSNFHSLEL